MKTNFAAILIAVGWMCCGRTNAEPMPPVPDLTNGGSPDATHDWTLGPTGARGWTWGWRGQTTSARQILITEVAPGSPSDGVLRKNDVVLGVNGSGVATVADLKREVERAGHSVALLIQREDAQIYIPIDLG